MVGFLLLLGWTLLHPASVAAAPARRSAPDITVRTFDGELVSVGALRGEPVVLNFWASWCAPCRVEAPALADAARAAPKVHFVGVAIQDDEAAARRFRLQFEPPYPVGFAVSGGYLAYGVTGPPETFFIDRRGMIRDRFSGPLDRATLREYLGRIS